MNKPLKPCMYESPANKMCRKCGQVHSEAIWSAVDAAGKAAEGFMEYHNAMMTAAPNVAPKKDEDLYNKNLQEAVFNVLEGYTLPMRVRKILETAYYAKVTE